MLIKNARIHTMEGPVIENGFLLTQGTVIKAVGSMENMPNTNDEVFDAKGAEMTPGFIDAHTHLGISEDGLNFEGEDCNEETDPSTPQLRALDAINARDRCFSEACAAGVTTVVTGPGSANPIGGQMVAMKTYGGRIDNMILKAPVSIKFALGENPKTVYHELKATPMTRMATASVMREQLMKARIYAQKLELSKKDKNVAAPEFDFKCESLLPLLRREVQAHFHAHRADDIFTAIRVSKEFNLDYVIIHGTEGHLIADDLAAEHTRVLSGPFLCDRCKPELKNQSPSCPGILAKAGVETAIVTDHPVIPIQYLPVCASLAVREGMEPNAALRAITINPAHILGLSDRVGSLREGKDADFVLFNGSPLDFYCKPVFVAINGKRIK